MIPNDWRYKTALALTSTLKGAGFSRFDRQEAQKVLVYLAAIDRRNKNKDSRVGFAYVLDSYTDSGVTRFYSICEEVWSISMPESQLIVPVEGAHTFQCVLSVRLDKDSYSPTDIHSILKDFLIQYIDPPFCANITKCKQVWGSWYDLLINYSDTNLPAIFKLLISPEWVRDGICKPISSFGIFSSEYLEK